jgi:hypothetical protein
MSRKIKVSDEEIVSVALTSKSATSAASILGIKYSTFKVHAERLGVFKTNQSGKGISKPITDNRKIPLVEILQGLHPSYQTNKLRRRIIDEGIKEQKCECCGLTEWLGKNISLELDHIDGNCYNHHMENLRIVCPNCHAQTETYRGKNKK